LAAALYDRPSGFTLPAGASVGTTAFAFRPEGPDTMKEVVAWRETREVAVVPGAWFGAPNGVRIALGKPPAAFREAIEAWQLALAAPARA
jgi:aspartate/methionine/tyrosine aminotransferase